MSRDYSISCFSRFPSSTWVLSPSPSPSSFHTEYAAITKHWHVYSVAVVVRVRRKSPVVLISSTRFLFVADAARHPTVQTFCSTGSCIEHRQRKIEVTKRNIDNTRRHHHLLPSRFLPLALTLSFALLLSLSSSSSRMHLSCCLSWNNIQSFSPRPTIEWMCAWDADAAQEKTDRFSWRLWIRPREWLVQRKL